MDTLLMMVGVSFDSKLVRLEENVKGITTAWIKQFQFQTGSIRSLLWKVKDYHDISCFNSKLVRLEGGVRHDAADSICVSIPNWFD